jgi:multiple sugar transport system permease protein
MTLVFYAPSIAGAGEIWGIMFNGDMYGYANSILLRFGFIDQPIQWLKDTRYMMTIVIVVQLWMSLGTSFLQLRAGFNTLDRQYFEAAAVDGINNRWQELWYVTLPLMAPHLWLAAVLQITSSFAVGDIATALCGFPSTGYAVYTMMAHLKDFSSIRFERGYAAAISTVLFLISYGANKLAQGVIRKVGK